MRMYEDDETEANSIIAWTERRLLIANNSYSIKLYVNLFKTMWIDSFGSLDSIPATFKVEVENRYNDFLEKEKANQI